ncbi:radical SAM protein [Flagellimonas sp.]|uniref:radical SAM protein n=1 Tax=Flagellimonas sp. TaxID=2058762 RepID=UPI003B52FAC6
MIELRLLGTKCNIACQYCYQNPLRDSGNGSSNYNLQETIQRIDALDEPFILWGGEPLLIKTEDLEELFKFGYDKYGKNQILTNGSLCNDNHIELFKRYNVHVTVSVDGPEELNDVRWNRTLSKTRESTKKSTENLKKLLIHKVPTSLNFQITKCNSTKNRLPKMFNWLRSLDELGLQSARIHVLEVDYSAPLYHHAFNSQENINAFIEYRMFERTLTNLRFDFFDNIRELLLGNDENSDCVWSACDPYTTEAVTGIDGQGRFNNCGNTDKEGINFQKPDQVGYERYISLYYTPDKYGGCKDCRFFMFCKGQCPGTASKGDWRNKSENCALFKALFETIEMELIKEGKTPFSLSNQRKYIEKELLKLWTEGKNKRLNEIIENLEH